MLTEGARLDSFCREIRFPAEIPARGLDLDVDLDKALRPILFRV